MKLNYFLLFFAFILFSCQQPMVRMVDEFYEDGKPKSVNYYASIEKKIILKTELYYPNGNLKVRGHFMDNQKHGQWIYFYENQNVSDEAWFMNGELHGRSSSSYKNGNLRSNGYYMNGEKVREWTFFDQEGKLTKRINYSE